MARLPVIAVAGIASASGYRQKPQRSTRRGLVVFASALVALAVGTLARADPLPDPPPPGGAEGAKAGDAKKEEAKRRFDQGVELFDRAAWEPALAEFLASIELYPTAAATKNAALCLRKLKRFDEALSMVERLLGFSSIPEKERAAAEAMRAELDALVGRIVIESNEAGATIVIDGRAREETPLSTSLRVAAGPHLVRAYKKGFNDFETRVDVPGGALLHVQVTLTPAPRGGDKKAARQVEGSSTPPGASPIKAGSPAPVRPREGRLFVEINGAFGLAPALGGDVSDACGEGCSIQPGYGFMAVGHGGYRFASGLSLGLHGGYFFLRQEVSSRAAVVLPVNLPANPGTLTREVITLREAVLGASGAFRFGEGLPLTVRLGAGALLGTLEDARAGRFTTIARAGKPASAYEVDVSESLSVASLFFAPEVRAGMRVGERLELTAGLQGLLRIGIRQARWAPQGAPVPASTDGKGVFADESLNGRVSVVVALGVGAMFDL